MIPAKSQHMQATVIDQPSDNLIGDEMDSYVHARAKLESRATASPEEEYEDFDSDWQSGYPLECSGSQVSLYNAVIQDSRITFGYFVETKFIPEHVQFKTRAGQTHYLAALKHLITPEAVNRMLNPGRIAHARLRSVPEWPYLDAVRLCDLNSDHVRRLVTAANAAGYSAQTVKHIKNVLFAIISHAQKEGCFNGPNPAGVVKLPKIVRRKQHNLTFEQTKAILQMLQSPLKEIALFAITTGMSLVEICDLRWKHVNLGDSDRLVDGEHLPARTLAVAASYSRADLSNGNSAWKSRDVEIREPLFSALCQLKCRNPYLSGDALVITSKDGEPILPTTVQVTLSKHVAKASGLPWLTWQVLRRARSSFVVEFLSQLGASSAFREPRISAVELRPYEFHRDEPGDKRATSLDSCRRRSFCFGGRKSQAGENTRTWTMAPELAGGFIRR